MTPAEFDLVVIGTGSAATTAAFRCRKAGWTVAIMDKRPFGGTCVLRGCDPKKVLVGAADLVDRARRMSGHGVPAPGIHINWSDLMRFKRTFTEPVPATREKEAREAGIEGFHGQARFESPDTVSVAGHLLKARHFLIATGATPASLDLPGEDLLTTSDRFLDLDSLPEQIVFLGAGYIAFEFAHLAARAGSRVTIVSRSTQALKGFDPDLVQMLVEHSNRLGIEIRLGITAERIERTGGLTLHGIAGQERVNFQAPMIVHAAGRVPDVNYLNLEAAHVDYTPSGVTVNEYLQSVSNPAVYAAGDAAASGGPPLTPVAGYESRIAAANMIEGNRYPTRFGAVPSVVFSIPPLAAVGMTAKAAELQKLRVKVRHEQTMSWYSSRRTGEECSGYKTLVEQDTGRILGAHLIGAHSEEVINIFAFAMEFGLTAGALKDLLYAYPTHCSDIEYML